MKISAKFHLPFLAFLAICVIITGLALYMQQVSHMLSSNTLNTMQEIANHDKSFVENSLDRSCNNLQYISMRLRGEKITTLQELQTRLGQELASSGFQYLYLIDANGKMYSGALLIQDGKVYPYVQNILKKIPRSIARSSETTAVDSQDETIVYAITIPSFKVEGHEFIGLIGQTIVNDVRKHMTLSSFSGKGTSMVIDKDGFYIVNRSDKNGIGQQENIFTTIEKGEFLQDFSIADIKNKMKNGKNFSCSYKLAGNQYVLSMTHLDSVDWYLAVTVPVVVFTNQSRQFVIMTAIMLVTILIIIISMIVGLFKAWKVSIEAQANAEAKTSFLRKMSHEIRTPLNALIGLNYLMLNNLQDTTKVKYYLEKSASTSQYLLTLINDILDISKLEQSAITLIQEPFSLSKITSLLQAMLKEQLEKKSIEFTVQEEISYPTILGDEMRLKQVLLNILSNALKFTPEKGHITLAVSQTAEKVSLITTTFKITDNGIGMSPEFQKHIFESFTQEKQENPAKELKIEQQGSGLGMAISYLLMQQMGGSLSVDSTLGQGSCFIVTLPATPASLPNATSLNTQQKPLPKLAATKQHILIAEDNKLNADILLNILKRNGYLATIATNGQKAVDLFISSKSYHFYAILMDSQMPVMDGYTAAQKIRSSHKEDAKTIQIFACTANTAGEDRKKAVEAGMNGFIAKPIDVAKLLAILQKQT